MTLDVRKRQLIGYLAAGVVVLAIAAGFSGGYGLGYALTGGGDHAVPPRKVPENVCAVVQPAAKTRAIPAAGPVKVGHLDNGDSRNTSSCELATDRKHALTYNEARLNIRVDRFGAVGGTSRTQAAQNAMREALDRAGSAGRRVPDLGDAAVVTLDGGGNKHWTAHVRGQYGDTLVTVDYATWLASRDDTESTAIALTREVLAGLS